MMPWNGCSRSRGTGAQHPWNAHKLRRLSPIKPKSSRTTDLISLREPLAYASNLRSRDHRAFRRLQLLKRKKHRSSPIGKRLGSASAGVGADAGDIAFPSALTDPGDSSSFTRSNPSGRTLASNRTPALRLTANEDAATSTSWTPSDSSLKPKPRRFLKRVVGGVRREQAPLADLLLDPSNPRRHSRQQIRAIARSIKAFGWLIPILVDAANRTIAGHGRYEAGRLLGLESVPVIRAEYLTREQAKAFMLADNRLAEGSD